MSLYRRGSTWWIELTTNGRRIRESAGTADKKAAQEYHEKRKGELWRQARLGEAAPVTWGEAVAKWLNVKPRGLPDRYRLATFGFDPKMSLPLPKSSIESLCSRLSSSSANRALAILIAIHNAAGIQPPKVEKRPNPPGRTSWLTAEQWKKFRPILEAESELLRQAADFTLATGLRENNVLNLEWLQIDARRRVAWIYADQIKTGTPLGVPLNDDAMAVLSERRGTNKQYVFAHPDSGLPLYKASMRAWYTALKKAKLKGFRWHDLRHTWASWHVMNGTPLNELQHLGGWKTAQMVQRYAHLSAEHLAAAAARVKPVSLRYNARKRGKKDTKNPTMGG